MKKLLILVTLIYIFLVSTPSFAQENSASDSAKTQVKYELPYPGLLPDSPFYFLRTTRDRIISFLISDPLKKSQFDLLQADKRLSAGIYLADKNKYEMAATTISKGENYFESSLEKAKEAKQKKQLVEEVVSNLYLSSLKHQEVLKDLENKTKGTLKTSFIAEEKRAADFEKKAKEIISQK